MSQYRMIVKRGDPDWFELLYKTFGERLPVGWERRRRERRQAASPGSEERRRQERRGPPSTSWTGLGFVIVRAPRQA